MCGRANSETTKAFLNRLKPVLVTGFVKPALLSIRALQMLLPWRNRTDRLAETFDELLTEGRKLGDLPERPQLCMNATVLNHGAVGRFSRRGFSCESVGVRTQQGSYPDYPLAVTVGFAAAASAAFPFGLPPLCLSAKDLGPLQEPIRGQRQLVLTDGGVLENLGTQLLLRSQHFGTKNIILSDAGTTQNVWTPTLLSRIKNFGAFALTTDTLSQLLSVMNDKQNKSMREILVHEVGAIDPPDLTRLLWFVRIDQNWDRFLQGIPLRRRKAIAGPNNSVPPADAGPQAIANFLVAHGINLDNSLQAYTAMGGLAAVKRANQVPTNFTGMDESTISLLEAHSAWQIHACRAVYGAI